MAHKVRNAIAQGRQLAKADFVALSELRYQLRCFLRFSEDAAKREGLTLLQYQLLLHIQGYPEREWALVGELAERLQTAAHGVVALVTRCQRAGLVKRLPGTVDRREVQVHLTAKGVRAVTRVARMHRDETRRLGEIFSTAQRSPSSRTSIAR